MGLEVAQYGDTLYQFVIRWGYPALFVGLALEGTGAPILVEVFFAAAGYLVSIGLMRLETIILVSAAGNVVGNLGGYALGAFGGRRLVARYGRYFRVKLEDLDRIKERFGRLGGRVVFIGRIIGITRTPTILTAGLVRMPLLSYAAWSAVADLLWCGFWASVWVLFTRQWQSFAHWARPYSVPLAAALAVLVAAYLYFLWRRFVRRRT
ncbi:MAG: DedA family protein [Firmicutes bacterium]|nr:DedA family protein [Bacillota bacterium]